MVFERWLAWMKAVPQRLRATGWGGWWLCAPLVLGGAGQAALMDKQLALGLALYTAAGAWFALLAHRAGWVFSLPQSTARGRLDGRAGLLALLAVGLVGISCYLAGLPTAPLAERRVMLLFWLGGVLIFSGAVLRFSGWRAPGLRQAWGGLRARRYEATGLLVLGGLALALRLIDLDQHPYAFANDEGWIGVEGWRILTGDLTHWFRVGWSAQPNLSFVPGALVIALFGKTIFAVRLVSALEGTLTVLFTYLVGREAFGRRVGWLAAFTLAGISVHIHFSRTAYNNILPAFYAALLVWLVLRALRRGEISAYLWLGLAAGSAFYTYLGSRLAMLLALGMLGYAVLFRRGYLRAHRVHLLVFAGALGLVIAPMLTFFIQSPELFLTRINTEGILQNGWLAREMASGRGVVEALLGQLERSALAFISQGGAAGFYNSPYPYLPPELAVFAVLGMAVSLSRARGLAHLTLQVWFWGVILTAGVLTTNPPQHQRLVMALPAAALLVGLGLEQTAMAAARLRLGAGRLWQILAGLAVAVGVAQGAGFYFGEYRQHAYYSDHANEVTIEAAGMAQQLNPAYRFISLSAPEVYLEFANFRYFLSNFVRIEYLQKEGAQAAVDRQSPAFYFTIPERRGDLEAVAAALPGGQWLDVPRRWKPEQMLFHAYIIPAVNPPVAAPAPFISGRPPIEWLAWTAGILLVAIGLELWLLPILWRALGKAHAGGSRGWAGVLSHLRTWIDHPLPELTGLPEPDLRLAWLDSARHSLAQLRESPAQETGQTQPVRWAGGATTEVRLDVTVKPGEVVAVELDPTAPEENRSAKA